MKTTLTKQIISIHTRNYQYTLRLLFLIAYIIVSSPLRAAEEENQEASPVLIVSSYNPDVKVISENMDAFYNVYEKSGLPNQVILEDIHALNLPDCMSWKGRLWDILKDYYADGKSPAAVVLLGNEVSAAYFSLDHDELKHTPVMIGLTNSYIVKLPEDSLTDLTKWEPTAYDIRKDFKNYNIIGGKIYNYDIKKNLDLINRFYKNCDTLVFLSDNTLGGIIMRSCFRQQTKNNHDYNIKYIDGRVMSFMEVNRYISNMPTDEVLLVGTWRIDRFNSFPVKNTSYTLNVNNPKLPVFSLSNVGMGHWPVAGYSPKYETMGDSLAQGIVEFLKTGKKKAPELVSNQYTFDLKKLKELGLSIDDFDEDYNEVNPPFSIFREYKGSILSIILIIISLASGLIVALILLKRIKQQKQEIIERNQQLAQAKKDAEKASAMKSTFIANMSHEIRTPLNAVIGFAQLLTSKDFETTDEEKAEFGEAIMMNSELLLKLVNDILDLSKFDAGKMKRTNEPTDIVELLQMAATSASVNKSDAVEILTTTPVDSMVIDTDKNRLLQVLSNLLSNAKKCTKQGTITIALEKPQEPNMLTISVTDTGCGIPKDKAEVIFERFKKLDEFKQGTGLGLAITRSIIYNLGGKIWVDTDYTDGARFMFTLPVST